MKYDDLKNRLDTETDSFVPDQWETIQNQISGSQAQEKSKTNRRLRHTAAVAACIVLISGGIYALDASNILQRDAEGNAQSVTSGAVVAEDPFMLETDDAVVSDPAELPPGHDLQDFGDDTINFHDIEKAGESLAGRREEVTQEQWLESANVDISGWIRQGDVCYYIDYLPNGEGTILCHRLTFPSSEGSDLLTCITLSDEPQAGLADSFSDGLEKSEINGCDVLLGVEDVTEEGDGYVTHYQIFYASFDFDGASYFIENHMGSTEDFVDLVRSITVS